MFGAAGEAIDPNRTISQYIRECWGNERGFPGGAVSSIAQTPDGYLWIGTTKGLIRFDGLNFHLYQQAVPSALPIGPVQGLTADAQGNLWILLQSTRILRYHDGKFEPGREEAEFGITSVLRRKDGGVLLSSLAIGTLIYSDGKFEALTSADDLADSSPKPPTIFRVVSVGPPALRLTAWRRPTLKFFPWLKPPTVRSGWVPAIKASSTSAGGGFPRSSRDCPTGRLIVSWLSITRVVDRDRQRRCALEWNGAHAGWFTRFLTISRFSP